jgi:hypothetical protein
LNPASTTSVAVEHVPVDAVQPHRPQTSGDVRVPGDDHAALAGAQRLGHVEAERGHVPVRADQAAVVQRRQRVGGIVEDPPAAFGGQRGQPGHVAGETGEVDRDQGADPAPVLQAQGLVGREHRLRGEVAGHRIHVGEDRVSADVADHLRGRGEGVGRGDHQAVTFDPEGFEAEVERGGPGVDGDRLPPLPDHGRERLLEAPAVPTGREPPAPEDLDHRLDIRLVDVGDVEGHPPDRCRGGRRHHRHRRRTERRRGTGGDGGWDQTVRGRGHLGLLS